MIGQERRLGAGPRERAGTESGAGGPPRSGPRPPAKGSFVRELREGFEVEGVFLVRRRSARRTREGRPFLALVLYDRTGTIDAQVWDDTQAFRTPFTERDFLRVRGLVDRFRDRLQMRILDCEVCRWEDLSADDFLPRSKRPLGEMLAELRLRIRSLSNPHLRALLERLESDPSFLDAFARAPAATTVHHDWIGGLLEHTLSLLALADAASGVYRDLDRDLLLAGAFFHDVGKIREISAEPGFPYTDEGQLIGHVVLGYEIAMRAADRVPGFPAELRMRLGHLILSHPGEPEWGASERPKTLEAIALHFLDNLDSKVSVFRKAVGSGGDEAAWTDYVRSLGRALYRGSSRASGVEPVSPGPSGEGARESVPDLFGTGT